MNPNSFFSSANSALQSIGSNDRLKSLFKSEPHLSNTNILKERYQEELKISIGRGESAGRQVFSKSIEFSLGVKAESSYEFKIPSPKEVAATVLGFVENRINLEKASGATTERLNDLLGQARSGIEKGYAQASKDIEGLGLMTEELSDEISEGFDLITIGLDEIGQKLEEPQEAIANKIASSSSDESSNESSKDLSTNKTSLFSGAQLIGSSPVGVDERRDVTNNNLSGETANRRVDYLATINQLTELNSDFVLKTQEGDQIYIRMSDLQQSRYTKDDLSEALDLNRSSRFEFSVKGDLNENELLAINDLLEQVETISSLFFSDQFEQAFSAALSLGFDSEQIASFSLDLSKLQVEEVRTYQESSKSAVESYKRNQPLINMVHHFERLDSLLKPLERFEKMDSMVEALVSKAIERYSLKESVEEVSDNNYVSEFQSFSKKLLESIPLLDKL